MNQGCFYKEVLDQDEES